MHVELGHFNEQHTLVEIYIRYYWHDCTEEVNKIVRTYSQYQSMKIISNTKSNAKEFKSIPIHDLFYHKALDIVGSLLETRFGNKYILVYIDHYLKWCEAKEMLDRITTIAIKLLENKII
jgi:hypothetical protein